MLLLISFSKCGPCDPENKKRKNDSLISIKMKNTQIPTRIHYLQCMLKDILYPEYFI